MKIRDCLKNAQDTLCMTQDELALLFGVSQGSIQRYVSGTRKPGKRTIRRIVDVLKDKGITLEYNDLMDNG